MPIENSPPGIQTIRAGAGPKAATEFETVGAKVIDPTNGHDSHAAAFDTGAGPDEPDLEVLIAKPITAPIAMTPMATNQRSPRAIDLLAGLGLLFRSFFAFFISPHRKTNVISQGTDSRLRLK